MNTLDVVSVVKHFPNRDYDIWKVIFSDGSEEITKFVRSGGAARAESMIPLKASHSGILRCVVEAERDFLHKTHGDSWREHAVKRGSENHMSLTQKITGMMYPNEPS